MADETKTGGTAKPERKLIATLVIEFDNLGDINVNGPITNKMLCYGMLENARDVVMNYKPIEVHNQMPGVVPFAPGQKPN